MKAASSHAEARAQPEWLRRKERGSALLIRWLVQLSLFLGRTKVRHLLPIICVYFLLFSRAAGRASRQYLQRVLGRRPSWRDVFRHYHCFASCVLDRVFLLQKNTDLFDIEIFGEAVVTDLLAQGSGCILVGAHIGSFEVLRAISHAQPNLNVRMLMFEENAQKVTAILQTVAPEVVTQTIRLGRPDSFLAVQRALAKGDFVGILADRSLNDERQVTVPYLGAAAAFSVNPFRLMSILRKPVVLMVGLYRGGNRYEIHFERFLDMAALPLTRPTPTDLENIVRRYVARLEHYSRIAPYNWFNFYNFWI